MIITEDWKKTPKPGNKFIYRYYDKQGKSYIGQTKQSLYQRAGGIDGKNYARYDNGSKFENAINEIGFENFEYEILEEVEEECADNREKYYINKFNTRTDGYNSTYGGKAYFGNRKKYIIDMSEYSVEQIEKFTKNIRTYYGLTEKPNEDLYNTLLEIGQTMSYVGYAYHKGSYIECSRIVLLYNFIYCMCNRTYMSVDEIEDEMYANENFGGDMFTSDNYNQLEVVLPNAEKILYDL